MCSRSRHPSQKSPPPGKLSRGPAPPPAARASASSVPVALSTSWKGVVRHPSLRAHQCHEAPCLQGPPCRGLLVTHVTASLCRRTCHTLRTRPSLGGRLGCSRTSAGMKNAARKGAHVSLRPRFRAVGFVSRSGRLGRVLTQCLLFRKPSCCFPRRFSSACRPPEGEARFCTSAPAPWSSVSRSLSRQRPF